MHWLFLLLIASQLMAQDISIVKPNQACNFKETRVCLTEAQFNKLDSLLADTARYQKQIFLLNKKATISDSIIKEFQIRVDNRENVIKMMQIKDSLQAFQDSLLIKKADIYKGLVDDLYPGKTQKTGLEFFNNTFWFGAGTVVGVAVMYLSSIIVQHVK